MILGMFIAFTVIVEAPSSMADTITIVGPLGGDISTYIVAILRRLLDRSN